MNIHQYTGERGDGSTADDGRAGEELNAEISEGETSGDDFSDGNYNLRTSTNNHTEWFQTKRRVGQRRQAIK